MAEFPELYQGPEVTICRAVGLNIAKGQPVDAYRLQLARPGRAFLFLTQAEFEDLAKGMTATDAS